MIFDQLIKIAETSRPSSGIRDAAGLRPYESLVQSIAALAAGFNHRGLSTGDVVALLIPNSPEIFVVAHALFAIGAVVMPLDPSAKPPELVGIARKAGVTAVIATPKLRAAADRLRQDVAPHAQLFVTSDLDAISRSATRLPKLAGGTTALYLASSGSTGLPKIVPHTHAELLADGERTSMAWKLSSDDIVIDSLPPNFAMGFLLGTIDAMYAGATTLYWSDPLPLALSRRKLLATMEAHRVSVIGAVPAMYEIISAERGDFDLALRLVFSGGAALKRPIFEAARQRLGVAPRQSYGSTEAIFVSHNDAADADASWASVGRPAGDAVVRLGQLDGLNDLGTGELQVKSSSLMQGYLGEEGANADAFDGEWFRTGDIAALDDEGHITIKGRIKLLIEVSGFKVDPVEIEDTLAAHPAVAELAITAIPDPRTGNRLRAYVVRKNDVQEDEIVQYARHRLSSQKIPAEVAFVDALPRSATGKLLRTKLLDL